MTQPRRSCGQSQNPPPVSKGGGRRVKQEETMTQCKKEVARVPAGIGKALERGASVLDNVKAATKEQIAKILKAAAIQPAERTPDKMAKGSPSALTAVKVVRCTAAKSSPMRPPALLFAAPVEAIAPPASVAAAPLASQPLQSDLAAAVEPDLESSASPDQSVAETIEASVDAMAQAKANVRVADEGTQSKVVAKEGFDPRSTCPTLDTDENDIDQPLSELQMRGPAARAPKARRSPAVL